MTIRKINERHHWLSKQRCFARWKSPNGETIELNGSSFRAVCGMMFRQAIRIHGMEKD